MITLPLKQFRNAPPRLSSYRCKNFIETKEGKQVHSAFVAAVVFVDVVAPCIVIVHIIIIAVFVQPIFVGLGTEPFLRQYYWYWRYTGTGTDDSIPVL